MTQFNIEKSIKHGISTFNTKCVYCKADNEVTATNKYKRAKIMTFKCVKCGRINKYGDAYNLQTYKRLGNRLDSRFDSEKYDNAMWSVKSQLPRKDI